MIETVTNKKTGHGLFTLAVVAYTAGVVALSMWSYTKQRNQILTQFDQSLIDATYATEQILGYIFIAGTVDTDTAHEFDDAEYRIHLSRYAEECRFDMVAALSSEERKIRQLVSCGRENSGISINDDSFSDLLLANLSSLIRQLRPAGDGATGMRTVDTDAGRQLRIALLYRSVSADSGYAFLAARSTDELNSPITALAIRSAGTGVFLFILAFPLIVLFNFARGRCSRETNVLVQRMHQDSVKLHKRENELKDAIRDLERFNTVTLGRESRIIELKAEVNTLLEQMNQQKRYNVDHMD